jgi:hypothetical protein
MLSSACASTAVPEDGLAGRCCGKKRAAYLDAAIAESLPACLTLAVLRALAGRGKRAKLLDSELPENPAMLKDWLAAVLPIFDEIHMYFSPECERDDFVGRNVWARDERGILQSVSPSKSLLFHPRTTSPREKAAATAAAAGGLKSSFQNEPDQTFEVET